MIAAPPSTSSGQSAKVEPLENGERMSAPEFLVRYEAMPHIKKAELIEGVVYMGSPVRFDVHAKPDNLMQLWIGTYAARTPGLEAGGNGTVRLDLDNVPQPDGLLRIVDECGGSSRLQDGYLVGPPELVFEISASSKQIDSHEKFRAYRRNGIKEYLIWRTLERDFDWFVLEEGVYRKQTADASGHLRSVTFPGLVLNLTALLAQDAAAVLETLSAALGSSEHRTFVAALASRKTA